MLANIISSPLDTLRFRTGLHLGVRENIHNIDFLATDKLNKFTSKYENITNQSFYIYGFTDVNLSSYFDFEFRYGFSSFNTMLTEGEFIGNVEINGETSPVNTIHNIDLKISMLTIEPVISLKPLKNYPIKIKFGHQIGLINTIDYSQFEKLTQEEIDRGITFTDGEVDQGVTRNNINGNLTEIKPYLAISMGLAYEYRVGKSLYLIPEVAYYYNYSDIIDNAIWTVNNFSMGLSVAYFINPGSYIDQDELEQREKFITDSLDNIKLIAHEKAITDSLNLEKQRSKQLAIEKEQLIKRKLKEEKLNALKIEKENKLKEDELNKEKNLLLTQKDNSKIIEKPIDVDSTCYSIIFESLDSRDDAQNILNNLNKLDLNTKVFIETWVNPTSKTKYYRIQTDCYQGLNTTIKARNHLNNKLSLTNQAFKLIIKRK
ncbi:hypothetical protein OAQ99_07375 [Candidatus Kapabacteria bacterium]|nr:hypothetical protein [Candidatus Kapabacteria bacterium]